MSNKTPIEECVDIGGSISSGYMSDFIFQGSRHARDTLTPYIGFNGGMDDSIGGFESSDSLGLTANGAGGGDVFHSGISLNVTF